MRWRDGWGRTSRAGGNGAREASTRGRGATGRSMDDGGRGTRAETRANARLTKRFLTR